MHDFFEFAAAHPVLTFFLDCIIGSAMVGVAQGLGQIGRRTYRCDCQCGKIK